MFYISDISGLRQTYSPGQIKANRKVNAVHSLANIQTSQPSVQEGIGQPVESKGFRNPYQDSSPPFQQQKVNIASDIMTSPVFSVTPDTLMTQVSKIFTERRFRHLPIVSRERLLVGIISDREVLRFNAARLDHKNEEVAVSKIMATNVLTATPDTLIRDIARIMFEERVGAIPIVDNQQLLVGLITRSDILRTLITNGPIQLWV